MHGSKTDYAAWVGILVAVVAAFYAGSQAHSAKTTDMLAKQQSREAKRPGALGLLLGTTERSPAVRSRTSARGRWGCQRPLKHRPRQLDKALARVRERHIVRPLIAERLKVLQDSAYSDRRREGTMTEQRGVIETVAKRDD